MKNIIILLLVLLMVSASSGQDLVSLSYQTAVPMSSTSDFIEKTSFRGFGMEWRQFVQSDISAGIAFNWNVFHQVRSELAERGNIQISGTQNRTLNILPLLVTGHYYMAKRGTTRAYAGLAAGAFFVKNRLDIGVFSFNDDSWHFGVAPEIGLEIPISLDTAGLISIKYDYAFKSGDKEAQSYVGINFGIGTYVF